MKAFATTSSLLPHQIDAVSKLLPTRVGALFMDMGTGKSRTAIEFARIRSHKIDRVLWFCPVALKETVRMEILKHTACTKEDIYEFSQKTNESTVQMDAMWYVIGLESISQSTKAALTTRGLITDDTFVIVDESTYIKGYRAKRTQRLITFCKCCRYRMILTGTPITQGIPDLFSQMYFLSPKILGYKSWCAFSMNHLEYHEKKPGLIVAIHNKEYLAEKMRPYVYQVKKEECLTLPNKLYWDVYMDLTEEQEAAYARAKDDFLENAETDPETGEIISLAIFHLFTSLQSIVCGFWNYNENWANRREPKIMRHETFPHRRIEKVMDIIERIPDGDKVIIWAKYRYSVVEIANALKSAYGEDSVALFYGGISEKERENNKKRFHADARFFVATQSCGGHGLTLNVAHYTIFYADGFKYSERLQAEDRNHRIGQEHKVTYITIQGDCGIEERIQKSLARKSNALRDFQEEIRKIKGVGIKEKLRAFVSNL